MSIIGIVLGIIAIGLFIWLKKEQQMNFDLHDGDIEAAKYAYNSLMEDFTNYQVESDRKIAELEKQLEIRTKQSSSSIDKIRKDLPSIIRKTIGHIEFARPLDRK